LIHTIGESAALGAAGFVIWGDLNLTSSRVRLLTYTCTHWSRVDCGLSVTNLLQEVNS